MAEVQSKPVWKRGLLMALRIYAGLCTILVTFLLGVLLFTSVVQKTVAPDYEAAFLISHGMYIEREYPKRGRCFWSMVAALRPYVAEVPMLESDLFNYLGKPDLLLVTNPVVTMPGQAPVTNRIALVAYLFDRPGDTTRWAATAVLEEDIVQDLRLGDAGEIDHMPFRPFMLHSNDSTPNQSLE